MAIELTHKMMTAEEAQALLLNGLSCLGQTEALARFQIGDRVRAKVTHPKTYTRLPRYVRGKIGTIARNHGVYVFPDTVGQCLDTCPQYVYSVRFEAQEVWGDCATANHALYIDLFDDHLEDG